MIASGNTSLSWPKLTPDGPEPVWVEPGFRVGADRVPFLSYGDHESGWDAGLTQLHETETSDRHPIDRASRELALEALQRHVRVECPWVLEVGASSGYFLKLVGDRQPRVRLVGSDFEKSIVAALSDRFPGLPIVQMDLARCPFADASFDAVVALNVLEHIEDDSAAVAQIHRVLKPGGIAHIEVPASPGCFDFYDEYLKHYRRYRAPELSERLVGTGFEILRSTHLGALVFPAFYWVKRRNAKRGPLGRDEMQKLVSQQVRDSKGSLLLSLSMGAELFAGRVLRYPFGIRAVLTVRKR